MDSVNRVSTVLSAEGKVKKYTTVIYELYISNKDNAVSAGITL
jgi:hypothetical protein